MALALEAAPPFDDDEAIERLSRASPGWQIEYDRRAVTVRATAPSALELDTNAIVDVGA